MRFRGRLCENQISHIPNGEKEESKVKKSEGDGIHYVAFVALVFISYANSLRCGLVFDDIPAIQENEDLRHNKPLSDLVFNDFWGTPLLSEQSHKSYRPLCVLTFRFNYWVHELDPFGYHLLNVFLHLLVSVMFYRLCLYVLPAATSFVATMLFASHPVHTEAVTGVVGRAELLSSVFFLLALTHYIRSVEMNGMSDRYGNLKYFAYIMCAVLSKEQGLTVVGVCALYDIVLKKQPPKRITLGKTPRMQIKGPTPTWRKDLILRLLWLSAVAILILVFRIAIMGFKLPVFNKFDNPASSASSPTRELTYGYLHVFNFLLMLYPLNLCCDWSMGSIPLVSSFWDRRNLSTVIFYLFLLIILKRGCESCYSHKRVLTMGLSLLVIPFIPASNIFFPVGFVIAERVLYLPSMGFCILVAYGFQLLSAASSRKRTKFFLKASVVILMCLNVVRTVTRNCDWESEEKLFTAGIRVVNHNAKLWNNLGHFMQRQGDLESALKLYLKAAKVQPDDVGSLLNIGNTYQALGNVEDAERAFWKAKHLLPVARYGYSYKAYIVPRHMELYNSLGNLISKNESRLDEAEQLFREASHMKPDFIDAYVNRASILRRMNRLSEARRAYGQALKHGGADAHILYNIGVLFLEEGNPTKALHQFDKALILNPQHEKSLINYVILSQDVGDSVIRRNALQRLQQFLDNGGLRSERIFFNMGVLAMKEMEYTDAERYFTKALQVRGNFTSALFNMALLLHNTGRTLEAVPYLEVLLKHKEYHLKGLMLLGNLYFSYLKNYSAAKSCFETILERESNYIPAFHNLCAVHLEMGCLDEAENCLLHARKLAPEEKYITEHLNVVRQRKIHNNRRIRRQFRNSTIGTSLDVQQFHEVKSTKLFCKNLVDP